MRLYSFHAKFKSLSNTELVFSQDTPLTCLIGLNGSGKSNILQGLSLAAAYIKGDFVEQIYTRHWNISRLIPIDINTIEDTKSKCFKFSICCTDQDTMLHWELTSSHIQIIKESFSIIKGGKEEVIFSVNKADEENMFVYTIDKKKGKFPFLLMLNTSVLSMLKNEPKHEIIQKFKKFISGFHSFDVLNPESLREPSDSAQSIGKSGSDLATFYHKLDEKNKHKIIAEMKGFYPWLENISSYRDPKGFHYLSFYEKFSHSKQREIPARYINDGTLRLLAILTELHSNASVVLLDEVENGFNPSIIEQLMKIILSSDKQIVLTTHSPDILQYIPDDKADDVIRLIYRTRAGESKNLKFLDIPGVKERLGTLSAGETVLDIDLAEAIRLVEEQTVSEDY